MLIICENLIMERKSENVQYALLALEAPKKLRPYQIGKQNKGCFWKQQCLFFLRIKAASALSFVALRRSLDSFFEIDDILFCAKCLENTYKGK